MQPCPLCGNNPATNWPCSCPDNQRSDIRSLALSLTTQWQTARSLAVETCLRISDAIRLLDVLVIRGCAERHSERDWYRLPQ